MNVPNGRASELLVNEMELFACEMLVIAKHNKKCSSLLLFLLWNEKKKTDVFFSAVTFRKSNDYIALLNKILNCGI